MKQLKFGITGFGKMGKIRLDSILRSKETKLVAIFDINHFDKTNEDKIHYSEYYFIR